MIWKNEQSCVKNDNLLKNLLIFVEKTLEKTIFEVFHDNYPVWDKAGINVNKESLMKTVIGSAV